MFNSESYKEAEERLKILEIEEYAFSQDSDMPPEEKSSEIVRKLKQRKLKISAEAEAAFDKVSDLHSDKDEDNDRSNSYLLGLDPEDFSSKSIIFHIILPKTIFKK